MKNSGITYTSEERTPIILPEMANLLPPLSGDQFSALEADILTNGCYTPVIVNEDCAIIDGHNRQKICAENKLPYTMLVFQFADMLEAKQWALDTQKGRRNLTAWELGQIALKLKPDIEARARANLQEYHGNQYESGPSTTLSEVQTSPVDTRKELADAVGIGQVTMGKVMQIDEHAPEVVKEALDKGELSINQGYNITKGIQKLPENQREDAAMDAVEQEKYRKAVRRLDAEADRQTRIANQFCKAFEKSVLLTPTVENVRIWVENCRMTPDEIEDAAQEAQEISDTFKAIGDILKNEILPSDWRVAYEAAAESGE